MMRSGSPGKISTLCRELVSFRFKIRGETKRLVLNRVLLKRLVLISRTSRQATARSPILNCASPTRIQGLAASQNKTADVVAHKNPGINARGARSPQSTHTTEPAKAAQAVQEYRRDGW